jgi:hypothetical protein
MQPREMMMMMMMMMKKRTNKDYDNDVHYQGNEISQQNKMGTRAPKKRLKKKNNADLGTNWLAGRLGRYSGCTMKSMCGKPVPK